VVAVGLVGFAVLVGGLIGAVGVGGVLLGPVLVAGGVDAHVATGTCAWAFVFTGVVGTWRYGRRGEVPWGLAGRLAGGALPAAVLGVWANRLLPVTAVVLVVAVVAVGAGAYALRPPRAAAARVLGGGAAVGVGAAVGFGSALTGTGGPVLLVPALLAWGSPALVAVGAGQVMQLPVAAASATAYLVAGSVRVGLGTALGVAAAAGVLVGAEVVRRAGTGRLRAVVGVACVAAGVLLLARTVLAG
jgi:uncharacterized protein